MTFSKKIRFFLFGLSFLTCITSLFAEESSIAFNLQKYNSETTSSGLSSLYSKPNDGEKHYLLAFGGVAIISGTIYSWNRYVTKSDWSKVTLDYMAHFYEHEASFDIDWYWTNFVLHPYQGGLYYMIGRGSNLNKIESFALSAIGSTAWEYFAETNSPSINDMIYTPIGGFVVGEMLYRLSLEADSVSSLLGKALNPTRLYTEPFAGRQTKPDSKSNIHDVSFKFAVGTQKHYTSFSGTNAPENESELFPVFAYPEINIVYNDPYGWDTNDPCSQFELIFHAGAGANSDRAQGDNKNIMYDVSLFANYILLSRAPETLNSDKKDTTIGFIFDYDFIWQNSIELSAIAPGFGYYQRLHRYNSDKIEWQFHQDWVILGSSDYYYYLHNYVPQYTHGDYSYNTGSKTKFLWRYITKNGSIFHTDISLFALWDFPYQVQDGGSAGWDIIGIANVNYELSVSELINVGIGNSLYMKKGLYEDAPDLLQTAYTGTVYARLKTKSLRH
ncbi:MAG: DUF3943 domain-containing protein [Treponema sp.]|nr:DUF3943 domain-containing protein [Treponema sp.]